MLETPVPQNRSVDGGKPRRPGTFAPGNNANPGGRPKIDPEVLAILRAGTVPAAKALVAMVQDPEHRDHLKACTALLDRVLGKPTEHHEHTGDLILQVLSSYAAEKAGAAEVAGHG